MERHTEQQLSFKARGSVAASVAGLGLKVYLWPAAFARMQAVQRAQRGSPRFDLGDLTSAAVSLLADDPNFVRRVIEQAHRDHLQREGAVGA